MAVADEFASALQGATKDLRAEKKARERDARKARNRSARMTYVDRGPTLKEAVFSVMRRAVEAASGGGVYEIPARNLYYAVRPRIQRFTDAELTYAYFDKLLVEYQEHEPIRGLYRDPRGELAEPHTGTRVPLGTREVRDYRFPEHVFDKILYVEKEGFSGIFETAQLAERYDLAIAAGKGQPVEAVRSLFDRAERDRRDYKLFVLHDADPAGYSIARTLAEETRRMPGHRVEVIDLGLTVADAIEHGLSTEWFTRHKALPYWMPRRLDATEREWFEGVRIAPSQWECTRAELNAFVDPGDLIGYIEEKLAEHGATDKLVPPAETITEKARTEHSEIVKTRVEQLVAELVDTATITSTLTEETAALLEFGIEPAEVTDKLEQARERPWTEPVADEITTRLDNTGVDLRHRVRALIEDRIGGEHT